jgi:hypothetical protein
VHLADGGTVTGVGVLGDRGPPDVRGNCKHGLPNRLGEVEADGEADAALTQGIEEIVGGAVTELNCNLGLLSYRQAS